jgi:predicted nuclease of predicted toxin-antitoxin system
MRWGFFIDANLEPRIAEFLREEGYPAEYSDYVLDEDADDEDDILPYVQQEELMIVTADIKNFAVLDNSRHEGLLLVNNQRVSAYAIANAVLDIVDAYRSPSNIVGKIETVDPWIQE